MINETKVAARIMATPGVAEGFLKLSFFLIILVAPVYILYQTVKAFVLNCDIWINIPGSAGVLPRFFNKYFYNQLLDIYKYGEGIKNNFLDVIEISFAAWIATFIALIIYLVIFTLLKYRILKALWLVATITPIISFIGMTVALPNENSNMMQRIGSLIKVKDFCHR